MRCKKVGEIFVYQTCRPRKIVYIYFYSPHINNAPSEMAFAFAKAAAASAKGVNACSETRRQNTSTWLTASETYAEIFVKDDRFARIAQQTL